MLYTSDHILDHFFFTLSLISNRKTLGFLYNGAIGGKNQHIFRHICQGYGQNLRASERAPFDLKIKTHVLQVHTKNSLELDFRVFAPFLFYRAVLLLKNMKNQGKPTKSTRQPGKIVTFSKNRHICLLVHLESSDRLHTPPTCSTRQFQRF